MKLLRFVTEERNKQFLGEFLDVHICSPLVIR